MLRPIAPPKVHKSCTSKQARPHVMRPHTLETPDGRTITAKGFTHTRIIVRVRSLHARSMDNFFFICGKKGIEFIEAEEKIDGTPFAEFYQITGAERAIDGMKSHPAVISWVHAISLAPPRGGSGQGKPLDGPKAREVKKSNYVRHLEADSRHSGDSRYDRRIHPFDETDDVRVPAGSVNGSIAPRDEVSVNHPLHPCYDSSPARKAEIARKEATQARNFANWAKEDGKEHYGFLSVKADELEAIAVRLETLAK